MADVQPEKMSEYIDDFVPCLNKVLSDPATSRETKIPTLRALGNLALHCGNAFN